MTLLRVALVGLRAQSDTVYCYVPNPSYGDKVVLIPYVQSTIENDTYYYLYSEDGENYTELEEGDVSLIGNMEYTPYCEEDTYVYFRLVVGDIIPDLSKKMMTFSKKYGIIKTYFLNILGGIL